MLYISEKLKSFTSNDTKDIKEGKGETKEKNLLDKKDENRETNKDKL
ncbi:MAG: hypothetical protein N2510_08440 [Ignavibacteria bacterium]|nr:hypothetical protein [Ignavibacteria bacterium]